MINNYSIYSIDQTLTCGSTRHHPSGLKLTEPNWKAGLVLPLCRKERWSGSKLSYINGPFRTLWAQLLSRPRQWAGTGRYSSPSSAWPGRPSSEQARPDIYMRLDTFVQRRVTNSPLGEKIQLKKGIFFKAILFKLFFIISIILMEFYPYWYSSL